DPEEVTEGPWKDLLYYPNSGMDGYDLVCRTFLLLMLEGEAFWLLRAKSGPLSRSTEIPRFAFVRRGSMFRERLSSADELLAWEYREKGGGREILDPWHVVQFKLPDPWNPHRGLAPLDAAMQTVRSDHKARGWNEASMDNGGEPGGILSTEQVLTDT